MTSVQTTSISSDFNVLDLKQRWESAGQGHVFQFWPKLTAEEQSSFAAQLHSIDVERVNRIYKSSIAAETADKSGAAGGPRQDIRPLPESSFESIIRTPEKETAWRAEGLKAIADGKVAVVLMAGGQGTRVGSADPKGMYDIGLPSHKSLFQYQAERIIRLQNVAEQELNKPSGSVTIPWYIMTSGPTRPKTVAYFQKQQFFGLNPSNVIFFEQGTLPCLTMDGKIILETPSRVAVAPDGNGGLYAALNAALGDSGLTVLSDLESRNIQYIHVYGVDNCLVRIADPTFTGYSVTKQADCAAKVVPKLYASESVGIVALLGDKFSVLEYSEIGQDLSEQRDPKTGQLAYGAANIANHFYTLDFLKQVNQFEESMAFHIARKKIPYVDIETGEAVKPTKPNGMKLELFIFDVFPYAKNMHVLEVDRKEEFSPLKNAPGTGSDDPETSRRDLLAQHRRYLEKNGATVATDVEIEISPLVTYSGEGLGYVKGRNFTRSGSVEALESFDVLQ